MVQGTEKNLYDTVGDDLTLSVCVCVQFLSHCLQASMQSFRIKTGVICNVSNCDNAEIVPNIPSCHYMLLM